MKKKGFTLIELLAVIVVLAIIALIATPIVLNLINNARVGAAEQSATGYVKAVENTIMKDMLNNKDISDGKYKYDYLSVDINGNMPTDGIYNVENGKVESAKLCINGYTIEYKNGQSKKISGKCNEINSKDDDPDKEEKEYKVYENGTAIYFNPETMTICNQSEAVSKTGTKKGCMKWYTYNDEGKKATTVNMILDHNTTARVTYNSTNSNSEMKEVKTALESDTNTWDKASNARLITANEVAKITGNTSFDEKNATSGNWFYLDNNNQTQVANSTNKSKYAWLFDYTYSCKEYGCNIEDSSAYGYWTSTPVVGVTEYAWDVYRRGRLGNDTTSNTYPGLRPVITISKSIIS